VRLQLEGQLLELARFSWGLDSKLSGSDLVRQMLRDVCQGEQVAPRATVMQQKTQRPVQFELTPEPERLSMRGSTAPACDRTTSCS